MKFSRTVSVISALIACALFGMLKLVNFFRAKIAEDQQEQTRLMLERRHDEALAAKSAEDDARRAEAIMRSFEAEYQASQKEQRGSTP